MITTELRNIEGRLTSNTKMNTGLQFMRLLREEGLLEVSTGIFPAICGGAVRDCLFTGNEINDIDIFFFLDTRSPSIDRSNAFSQTSLSTTLADFRNNVLAWLEDQEIECESLLSQRASDYFGGQRFLDIIQFEWQEVTIQLMVPVANQLNTSVDYLLRTMPIYSGLCVTQEYFRAFDTTIAHMYLPANEYFIATDRDIPYLRNKTAGNPEAQFRPVSSSREAVQMVLNSFSESVSVLPERSTDLTMEFLNMNSTSRLVKRALASRLSIDTNTVTFDSRITHRL